ncbi:MAG: TonB-dependent receptor [Bacteroidia bacterium]|nr:TonB-dependent receptor [Bacteroidia bacterium]
MKQFSLFILFGMLIGNVLLAQSISITGQVTSGEDGSGIAGATVRVKNTAIGTLTDDNGNYRIDVPGKGVTLIFSYVTLESQEIEVGENTVVNVVMGVNVALMDEVVVIGYGTQKRSTISGSVSTINAAELTELPSLRIEQALQGRAAGIQVAQNSGSPGSALSVRIRGTGTIGDSEPLYVVDGIPVGGLDFLNVNDIESVSVLKDAASAAIYGARAANGVVLITTRQGKKNQKAVIAYDGYYGTQSTWKKLNLLNAREYAILANEAYIAAGRIPLPQFSNPDALGEGTDWQDAIFTNAPIQSHQISITGGNDRNTYAVSGNYFNQEGIIGADKSAFERLTLRINNTFQATDRLKLGSNLNIISLQRSAMPENNEFATPLVRALNMDPITPVTLDDGTFAASLYSDTDIRNPANQIALASDNWLSNRIVGSLFAEYQLIEGLNFRSAFNLDATFARRKLFSPAYQLYTTTGQAAANEQNLLSSILVENPRWRTWIWENTLTYTKTFAEKHNFTFLGGYSRQEGITEGLGGVKADLPSNDPDAAYIGNARDRESEGAYDWITEEAWVSYIARVNYDYENRYLLSLTARRDGSSKFGENNRFGFFPSVSLGWVVSNESFFKVPAINFLKVRASWGQNGNDRIGAYQFTSVVNTGQNYTFGENEVITNGSAPVSASNPNLRWETVIQSDLGIDLGMLNDRITFTTDLFLKQTRDMLVTIPILDHIGAEPSAQNAGTIENKGIEFAAEYNEKIGELRFSLGGNIAFIQNSVTSLGNGGQPVITGFLQSANGFISRTEVGHPVASFYGYVTDGIFQTQEEVAQHAFQDGAEPGDIRFRDLNDDGIVNEADQTFIGNPTPDFTYGITGSVSYKGIDLNFFLQGTQGNDIYQGYTRYDFTYINVPNWRLNRWTGTGTSDDEPRVILTDPNQNARISDRFVEDGSYMRVKNVQLGYTFPQNLTEKIKVNKLRLYVSGNNLFTLTGYRGLDPEIGTRGSLEIGIDRGFYPQARSILGGLNLSF